MTEEELEEQIRAYHVKDVSLLSFKAGEHASDLKGFEAATNECERSIGSSYQFRLPPEWRSTKGRGVRVGILDTGIDTSHPDLKDSIIHSKDFTGQGIDDLHGHGTHVAGIIGARSSGTGLNGVATECQLLISKVLNNDGFGSFDDIAEGVDWAVDHGANIICMSMCGPHSSPMLYRSLTYALAKGVHIICAAGQCNEPTYGIGYPGKYGGVITVASHGRAGLLSHSKGLDVSAPGLNFWSTYKAGTYRKLTGNSVAASFVAGIAALMVSRELKLPLSASPIFNCEDLYSHLAAISEPLEYQENEPGRPYMPPFLFAGSPKPDAEATAAVTG